MRKIIFIDNGATGSIGTYDGTKSSFYETPKMKVQDYTKAKREISRICVNEFSDILKSEMVDNVLVVLERPATNREWSEKAKESSFRSLEAELVIIEMLGLPYMFCDSKEWQRGKLPSSGKKGVESKVLKKESKDIGIRMFPQFKEKIEKHGDADSLIGAYVFWKKENIT